MKKTGENNHINLTETHKIKAENINVKAYFLSLTANAFDAGLLDEQDMENFQSQIYDILSDSIWMHTRGTSTSVTSEEAKKLMLSVLHVLDSFCISETGKNISIENEHKLIDLLKLFKEKAGIKKCYEKGLALPGKTQEA